MVKFLAFRRQRLTKGEIKRVLRERHPTKEKGFTKSSPPPPTWQAEPLFFQVQISNIKMTSNKHEGVSHQPHPLFFPSSQGSLQPPPH